jgi:Mannose-6-phosphate isomerase
MDQVFRNSLSLTSLARSIASPIPFELIEVQVDSYSGEDDIVRLDDVYRRHAQA